MNADGERGLVHGYAKARVEISKVAGHLGHQMENAAMTAACPSIYYPNCGALHRARFDFSAGTAVATITRATAATCFDIHRQQSLEDCSGLVHRYASGATGYLIGR